MSNFIDDDFISQNNARIFSTFETQLRLKPESAQSGKKAREVCNKEMDMLLDINNRFDVTSSQRAKDLGLSAGVSNRVYKSIEKEQLVESIFLNPTGKSGGLSKFHELTDKGYKAINRPVHKKYSGGKGIKHVFLQRYFKKRLPALGFKEIGIEKEFCGKKIDVFCKYHELKIAIEICISTMQTEHINVLKNIDKCDLIMIVCPDKKTKQKLEKVLYRKIPRNEKVKICAIHELLDSSSVEELLFKKSEELFNNF